LKATCVRGELGPAGIAVLRGENPALRESKSCYYRWSVDQSVLVSGPIGGPSSDFCYCQTVAGLLMGAFSDERTDLSFTVASGPRQRSHSRPESRGINDHILLSEIRDFPNLEGQVIILISPRYRVTQLRSQALGSLFVASCDSHDYAGGIRTRLHARLCRCFILKII
jgi:hypothetical protein